VILTHAPADGDKREWQFRPDDMLNHESEAIERRTEWTWQEFLMNLQKGSTLARRALLWTMLRREHHVLRFEDVSFAQGEVSVDYERGELAELLEQAQAAPDSTPNKDGMIRFLVAYLAKRPDSGSGKALASSEG
jgi:hypothetical protein